MSSLLEKEKQAIETLKAFNKEEEPYYLCYSGGKDSDTVRILADIAGVNYELHNNHTTVDSPVTVHYIRDVMKEYGEPIKEVDDEGRITYHYGEKGFIHIPDRSMWRLIADKKFPPTRLARYCCAELKEKGGKGRRKLTGVRKSESAARRDNGGLIKFLGREKDTLKIAEEIGVEYTQGKKGGVILNTDNDKARRMVESCYRTRSSLINPIIDWTDDDVWNFLHHYGCDSNPEYCNGQKRVGCIGCPLSGSPRMKMDFKIYPKYKLNYINAFDKMLKNRAAIGLKNFDLEKGWYWRDGESVMRWWVGDDPLQITIDDYFEFLEQQNSTMDDYE